MKGKGDEISINPNPAKTHVTISNLAGALIANVNIYNQVGQIALQSKLENSTINISQFPKGLYTVEAKLGNKIMIKKLIVE